MKLDGQIPAYTSTFLHIANRNGQHDMNVIVIVCSLAMLGHSLAYVFIVLNFAWRNGYEDINLIVWSQSAVFLL